jgi:protein-disulfide isomerase
MFENQATWQDSNDPMKIFTEFAKQLKLDTAKFVADAKSSAVADRVNADIVTANAIGVDSTPSFYLNGKKMQISSLEDFKSQLTAAIK